MNLHVALVVTALVSGTGQPLSLTGVVRDASTGRPLPGAAVRIADAGSVDAQIAIADADGRYRLTALPPGRYEVSARLEGYLDGRFGQSRVTAPGRLVDLRSTSAVADLVLWPGAVITGIVFGSDGRPRSGIEVSTLKRDIEFGQARLTPAGRPVRTNDRGEYRIFGLVPGRYYVLASPPIGGAAAFGSESDSYTYAPGVTDPREAIAVDAVGGRDAVAHFTLQRRPVYRVSGTVDPRLLAAGGPVLVEFRLLSTRAVRIVAAQRDGAFEVKGLLPGRYKASVGSAATRSGSAATPASTIVEVLNTDVDGITLAPLTRTTVRGRIRLTVGRSPSADDITSLRISSVPEERETQPGLPSAAVVNTDATFVLDVWPGQFVLRLVTRRTGWVIVRVTQHGRDVTSGLGGTSATDIDGIEVVVTDTAPRLRGFATRHPDASGDCAVIAFATDHRLWRTGAGLAQAVVGDDGAFTFSTLAPGDYFVAAAISPDTLADPDLLGVLRARATRVRLNEGSTTDVTVTCAGAGSLPPS